jgi:hypothetical protein
MSIIKEFSNFKKMEPYQNIKKAVSLIYKIENDIDLREWSITEELETAEEIDKRIEQNIYRLQDVMDSMRGDEKVAAEKGMFYEDDNGNFYPLDAPSEFSYRILPDMKEGFLAYTKVPVKK